MKTIDVYTFAQNSTDIIPFEDKPFDLHLIYDNDLDRWFWALVDFTTKATLKSSERGYMMWSEASDAGVIAALEY